MSLTVLFEDDALIAVDKPSGLLVHRSFLDKHETQFAMQMVRDQIGQHVFPLHRLDRPTSGILLFAKSAEIASQMQAQFVEKTIQKRYVALTRGFAPEYTFLDKPLKYHKDKLGDKHMQEDKAPQEAQTAFHLLDTAVIDKPLGKFPTVRYSLVSCFPKTGRKHQIRRHLKHLSHPIIGDVNHGDNTHNHFFVEEFGIKRLMLFATDVRLMHPLTNKHIDIHAPFDESTLALFAKLGWASDNDAYQCDWETK